MFICLIPRRTKKNERWLNPLVWICAVLFLANAAFAQMFLPGPPPPDPADYGKVILDTYASTSPGGVVFDHWLHRSKFTCRICHVDIGFAMRAKATGVRASTNHQGFHCGVCHNGKTIISGKAIFASCSLDRPTDKQCARCHSLGKNNVREYEYRKYTAKFPRAYYGIDWMAAEIDGLIKPIDFLEGISVQGKAMQNKRDVAIPTSESWVKPVNFSHEKHSIWGGCELCHPEIFPPARADKALYSMYQITQGRYCGACHGKVAFPINNCNGCHPGGPDWLQH